MTYFPAYSTVLKEGKAEIVRIDNFDQVIVLIKQGLTVTLNDPGTSTVIGMVDDTLHTVDRYGYKGVINLKEISSVAR